MLIAVAELVQGLALEFVSTAQKVVAVKLPALVLVEEACALLPLV